MRQAEQLDTILNTADGVFVVDANQRIISWNKGAERILRYTESEVLNHNCYRVIAGRVPSDKLWCHANCKVQACVAKSSQMENFDLITKTNEGVPIWINVTVVSPRDGSEKFTAHILRDVTHERNAERAIDQFLLALGVRTSSRSRLFDKGQPPLLPARTSPPEETPSLSSREIEVLKLLAEGLSTKALAQRLSISHFTARNHIQNILVKLDLHSKAQAVSYAFKKGLI